MRSDLHTLKESSEFLNLLLDNINSAVLVADEKLNIHQFNNSFLGLFDRAAELIEAPSFGEIAGCVNAVRENKSCGETSRCKHCVLKKSLILTFLNEVPVDRKRLERIFYINGEPILKYLEFSSRRIRFRGRRMILVIIYDITEIEQQKRELEKKQAQIDKDLEAAYEIQKSLLPHHGPDMPDIRSAWRFEPCQQIGGDIFQIYLNSDRQISLYTLDVCGHGVSAALVAVTVSQFLHSLHNRIRLTGKPFTPANVIQRLDKEFPLDRFDCYFTIAYATLELDTGRLVYSNAGHVPPLILRANGELSILKHHGTVIGTGFATPFEQEERQLKRGDRFILYTDGLIDNFGQGSEASGKTRFYEALIDLHPSSIEDMVNGIFNLSETLLGETAPSDDMSLLAIEYTCSS